MRHLRVMILLLAAAFALALVVTRALFMRQDTEAALVRTTAAAEDLARIVEQYARRTFETSDLVTTDVVEHVQELGGVAALHRDPDAWRYLNALAGRAHYDFIVVVDAQGIPVVANYGPTPANRTSLADQPWFQAHLAGADGRVGEAIFGRVSQEVMLAHSRAIRRRDGTLDGVVQVAVRPQFFGDVALTADTGRQAVLGLWAADGQVIARTQLDRRRIGTRTTEMALLDQALHDGAASRRSTSTYDGRDRVIAFRRVADWPVLASASLPVGTSLAPYAKAHGWSGWVVVATLLAVGTFTWFALRFSLAAEGAARAVAEARTALEARVEERTHELAEANARLAHNEERYRGIFNASFQFIGLLAPDGTVLEANDTALAFAGATAAEVVGRPFWQTPWWRDNPAAQDQLRQAIARAAQGEFVRYEVTVRGSGETAATIDFSLKPVRNGAGELVLLVPEGRDVTQLKVAQAQLHEAQKLETLGQLTGGVAHDFNNLLMVVLGNLALIKKRLGTEDARIARLLDGATQGAERGAALTRRLLAFARRQELRPEAIDLARLMAGMDELLHRTVGPLCRIVTEIPPGLPQARADVNQVELALLNLAVNARDAMPLGGDLRITARAASSTAPGAPPALAPGRYLCLAVTDSGTGMDAATLARATEPFFTTKGVGKGSGLGLSMVHGLAAQSGGVLHIESTPGRGTTVELWLPVDSTGAAPAEPLPAEPPPEAPRASRPLAILLVDDDPLVQSGSAAMLEDLGHRVTLAGSGAAALELLAAGHGFDLMITDFAMPGMDGLDLARRATQLRPLLPVVLATGFADLAVTAETTLPRLDKPYRQEALAALIGRVVDRPGPTASSNVVRLPLVPRS